LIDLKISLKVSPDASKSAGAAPAPSLIARADNAATKLGY
jgi:hypothetical protein